MSAADAVQILRSADVFCVAGVDPEGAPVLRTLNGFVDDGCVVFHGAPRGEKLGLLGPAVVTVSQVIARVPSYFVDAERACPATTYYVSVLAHGTIERVDEATEKGRLVQLMMQHLQPEGGHVPVSADCPLYAAALGSLLVYRLRIERVTGKRKLGQHRSAAQIEGVIAGLWRRGAPGDLDAIEAIHTAHPDRALPAALRIGTELRICASPRDLLDEELLALVRGQYWTLDDTDAALARSQRGSAAWVGARTISDGTLVGTARAISDGAKHAHVADVVVHSAWRGRGVGTALVAALLDHPRVRDCTRITLGTRDAAPFYERFGFVARDTNGQTITMLRGGSRAASLGL